MKLRSASPAAKLTLVAAMLFAATPAMASDFTGIIYIFLVGFAVLAIIVSAVVFGISKAVRKTGPVTDAIMAILLASVFAPTTFVYSYGEWTFSLWPVGMWVLVPEIWPDMLPGAPISIAVTALLIFIFLRGRHKPLESDAEAEVEAE